MNQSRETSKPRHQPGMWLLPVVAVAGLVAACVVALTLAPGPTRTVADVRLEISDLVLRKSDRPNATDGGAIGPWWVSAQSGDVARGEFRDFQLKSGSMQIAAKNARLLIDADAATFSFELSEAILMRLPDDGEEASVLHMDQYTLGPVPLRGRIARDEPTMGIVRARE